MNKTTVSYMDRLLYMNGYDNTQSALLFCAGDGGNWRVVLKLHSYIKNSMYTMFSYIEYNAYSICVHMQVLYNVTS